MKLSKHLLSGVFHLRNVLKFGSSEIWSDKLKVLYNRHTESRRDGGNAQCHGGADGTKSDGACLPILLAIYIQSVYFKIVIKNLYATPPSLFVRSAPP